MLAVNSTGETERFFGCDRLGMVARHLGLLGEEDGVNENEGGTGQLRHKGGWKALL